MCIAVVIKGVAQGGEVVELGALQPRFWLLETDFSMEQVGNRDAKSSWDIDSNQSLYNYDHSISDRLNNALVSSPHSTSLAQPNTVGKGSSELGN